MSRDGRKTGGRDFVPGDPRAGRPRLPEELKAAKRLNKTEFEAIINKYLWLPLEELEAAAHDKSIPTIEAWMVAIMVKGRTTGEWSGYEWIAQRLLGKVKEQVEVTQPKPFIVRHMDGTQTLLGAKHELPEGGSDES
jgi:hypothetical protein